MKSVLSSILLVGLVVGLSGCGDESANGAPSAGENGDGQSAGVQAQPNPNATGRLTEVEGDVGGSQSSAPPTLELPADAPQ